jgi:hypothetical protein
VEQVSLRCISFRIIIIIHGEFNNPRSIGRVGLTFLALDDLFSEVSPHEATSD